MLQTALDLTCQHVNLRNPVNLITEKLHTHCRICIICRKNFQHITAHPKSTSMKIHIVSHVLDINKLPDHIIPVTLHARSQRNHHILIIHRTSQTIDTGNTGYNDNITAFCQCRSCGKTQFVNLLVDGGILRNVGVCRRYVCFRLIIIVIGNKIFHCIVWEKFLHLPVKLRRQRLIVCNDQRRFVQLLNNICHGKCLTGTCDSKQRLELIAFFKTCHEICDGFRLIPSWLIFRY